MEEANTHRAIINNNIHNRITGKILIILVLSEWEELEIISLINNHLNIKITPVAIIATKIIKHNNTYQKTNKTKIIHLNNNNKILIHQHNRIIINLNLVKARIL